MTLPPFNKKVDYIYQAFYLKTLLFLKDFLRGTGKGSFAPSSSSSFDESVGILGRDLMDVVGEVLVVWYLSAGCFP
jgi:hypothetical protein